MLTFFNPNGASIIASTNEDSITYYNNVKYNEPAIDYYGFLKAGPKSTNAKPNAYIDDGTHTASLEVTIEGNTGSYNCYQEG
jgi:hypothetical protein